MVPPFESTQSKEKGPVRSAAVVVKEKFPCVLELYGDPEARAYVGLIKVAV